MRLFLLLIFCFSSIFAYADTVMVQVRFRVETAHGQYNDALYFTQERYATLGKTIMEEVDIEGVPTMVDTALKQEDIDTLKQERVDNWIYTLENPPPYVEPTLEELQSMKTELMLEVEELNNKIAILSAEVIE
ncbi:hypothetical protein LCGC14_1684940 [marine sediment metagenome]|uniref:Uncharacterized protein n=1 Tax=marine sediment metagenome TaxID=412755 RepID=A0A0F9K331_9ZZZZ